MSKEEELKAQIGYPKLWLGICIASGISMLGWLFGNFETAEPILLASGLIAIMALTAGIFLLDRKIRRQIRRLRDL